MLGSWRRAVMAAGVLVDIIDLMCGMMVLASLVRDGRMWCGSLVESSRSRSEK